MILDVRPSSPNLRLRKLNSCSNLEENKAATLAQEQSGGIISNLVKLVFNSLIKMAA